MASSTTRDCPFFTWSPTLTSTCAARHAVEPRLHMRGQKSRTCQHLNQVAPAWTPFDPHGPRPCKDNAHTALVPAKTMQLKSVAPDRASNFHQPPRTLMRACSTHLPDTGGEGRWDLRALNLCWCVLFATRLRHGSQMLTDAPLVDIASYHEAPACARRAPPSKAAFCLS